MNTENAALDQLRRRFSMRLDAALDTLGYPVLRAGRTRSLAISLGVDMSVATALMSGLHLPDYEQLLALCGVLRQQPGYFLDEHVLDVPPGTTVVKSMDIGEDLVLRLPSEVLSESDARKGLRYWRTTVAMGFGIAAGEYLIALLSAGEVEAEPSKLYLLSSQHGINVVQCVEVHSDRAMFHMEAESEIPVIVPTTKRGKKLRDLHKLVASVKCGSNLHIRA